MKKLVSLLSVVVLLSVVLGAVPVYAADLEQGALPRLHVSAIDLVGSQPPEGNQVVATVSLQDQQGAPVPGAMVFVQVYKPLRVVGFGRGVTDQGGQASWTITSRYNGLWSLCVVAIIKVGYLYNPADNVETCDAILYP